MVWLMPQSYYFIKCTSLFILTFVWFMPSAKNPFLKYIILTWLIVISPVLLFFTVILLTSMGTFGELPEVEELQNPKNNLASIVYSSDGNVLGKFYKENRVNVKYSEISPNLVHALIATEDARFMEHSGVDLKALFRSVTGVLTGTTSAGGGSTLTQQLAKMQFPREN